MVYELVNIHTFNSLAAFDSPGEALEQRERAFALDDRYVSELAIVAFDDEGLAVEVVEMPPGYTGSF